MRVIVKSIPCRSDNGSKFFDVRFFFLTFQSSFVYFRYLDKTERLITNLQQTQRETIQMSTAPVTLSLENVTAVVIEADQLCDRFVLFYRAVLMHDRISYGGA
jgi:hypothetical protein